MNKEIIHVIPQSNLACFVIPNLFSEIECNELLNSSVIQMFQESNGYYPPFYRNNERLVIDDEKMAELIFNKIKDFIPESISIDTEITHEKGEWKLKGLNHRFRYCRYSPGQFFSRHLDGIYYQSDAIQSKLTFMVYLNDSTDFVGGRTLFYENKDSLEILASYYPRKGDLIVFDHNIWHEGEEVVSGNKYVLRSDILYEKIDRPLAIQNIEYAEGHLGYIWKMIFFNDDLIISGGRDKVIKVWNKAGVCIQRLMKHQQSILSLAQINENIFVSGARDKTICIWERSVDFRIKETITAHHTTILAICGIDENTFASAGADGKILIHGLDKRVKAVLEGHQNWVWGLLKVDENTMISWSEDATIRIWDLITFQCIDVIDESSPIHVLVYDSVRQELIIGNYNGEIKILAYQIYFSSNKPAQIIKAHQGIVRDLIIIDDDYIVSAGEDNKIKVWDKRNIGNIATFNHLNFVQSLLYLGNRSILSASYDGSIKTWNI